MKESSAKARKRVIIFGCSLVFIILLGTYGFYLIEGSAHPSTLLYRSVQLFNLESGAVEGEIPLPLELARWLAPATLAGGLIAAASTFFRRSIDQWRARGLRGHHIICGLGSKGATLAAELLSKGQKVVALDPGSNIVELNRLQKLGLIHLPVKACESTGWDSVGCNKAATFTALTPNDADNLAMALGMQRDKDLADQGRNRLFNLKIFVHVKSVVFRDLLDRSAFLGASIQSHCHIRTFSDHTNLARVLLQKFPLETAGFPDGVVNHSRSLHVILGSLCDQSMAMLVHSARIGHYLGERKVYFHLVAPTATTWIETLRNAYPSIDQCCAGIEAIETTGGIDFGRRVASIIRSQPESCFTVIPCFNEAPGNLVDIIGINEEIPAEIPFRMLIPTGFNDLLQHLIRQNQVFASRLEWQPDISEYCGEEAVFNGRLDRIARNIHEKWLEETECQILEAEAKGDRDRSIRIRNKPTFKSWESCTEEQKDANRAQADHMEVKIRAANLSPKTCTATQWLEWCVGNPESLELLARVEHERWAAHLLLSGWTSGPERSDTGKIHDNLIAYEDLDEPTKEYDRDACRKLANYLSFI